MKYMISINYYFLRETSLHQFKLFDVLPPRKKIPIN